MSELQFESWLAPQFEKFIALKRAGGCDYSSSASLLAGFDRRLAANEHSPPLRARDLRAYLRSLSRLSGRGRDNHVSVVWQALAYAQRHGAPVEPLPERPRSAPVWSRLREPFVLSLDQIERLLTTARQRSCSVLARSTHSTLLGLLYTVGLRVGEALHLDVRDLDLREETLLIREGKFKKTRLLPIPSSTVAALDQYLSHSLRQVGRDTEAPLFVSSRQRRLSRPAAAQELKKAAALAGVKDGAGRLPRLLDLRHTFAVHRVAAWYREGRDVNALLPVLSTYMGHVTPGNTYRYLRSAELLFGEAARRFELSAGQALDGRHA